MNNTSTTDLDNDDAHVGRILNRREVLSIFGLAGAGLALSACGTRFGGPPPGGPGGGGGNNASAKTVTGSTAEMSGAEIPNCIVAPAMTEGPYFVEEKLNRSDIRPDAASGAVSAGALLKLNVRVFAAGSAGCTPLKGAVVDVWHCDAAGVYSDVNAAKGKNFCRGLQVSDANGLTSFTTVYPGWYQGRAVHIHFKVRTTTADGKNTEFTSQWFFDPALTTRVYANAPYKGSPDTPNSRDGIYAGGGQALLLDCKPDTAGYAANFDLGIKLS